ncbi:hypothetical protein RP20_CCG006522 [Aedes albopictus]|nr:hypothetical protein RP20_CCG006522 [Aedes albopictus]
MDYGLTNEFLEDMLADPDFSEPPTKISRPNEDPAGSGTSSTAEGVASASTADFWSYDAMDVDELLANLDLSSALKEVSGTSEAPAAHGISSNPAEGVPSTSKAAAIASTSTAAIASTSKAVASTSVAAVASTSTAAVIPPHPNKGNCILVSRKQRGNPLLKFMRKMPWEYTDIVPDYVVGATSCVLFLSMKYHILNPDYIHGRLKKLGTTYKLRILLLQMDNMDSHSELEALTLLCLESDLTMMLASDAAEAARIIELYKEFENAPPPPGIMGPTGGSKIQRIMRALTSIKPINRKDALTLIERFHTLAKIMNSSEKELMSCPGIGAFKAKQLYNTFNDKFKKS